LEAWAECLDLGADAIGARWLLTDLVRDGVIASSQMVRGCQVRRHHRNPVIAGGSGSPGGGEVGEFTVAMSGELEEVAAVGADGVGGGIGVLVVAEEPLYDPMMKRLNVSAG
jgi:hypothetical protein